MKKLIIKIKILKLQLKIKFCAEICLICRKIEKLLYKFTTFEKKNQ